MLCFPIVADRSWSSAKMTAKIAIGVVCLVLVLFNLNGISWMITTLKFVMARATLYAMGSVIVVTIFYLHNISSPWRRVIISAISAVLATVLILLNSNSPWLVLTLKVVTALVISFAIGLVFVTLILYLLNPSDLWSRGVILFSTGVVLAADVFILLNPSVSWSWVLMTLKFFKILVTLISIGIVFAVYIFCLLNLSSLCRRVILFSIGVVLIVVIVLQNASSVWSWAVMIMKLVILFFIGMIVAHLILYLQSLKASWRGVILFSIGAVLVLLKASSPWSWAVMILKFVLALVTLFAIGIVAVYLVLCLLNLSGSWRRVILFAIGVALCTVLILLNPSSPWSWLFMTLKVFVVAVILFPIGVLAAYLILHVLNVKGFSLWLIYFFGMNKLQFLVAVLSRSWLRFSFLFNTTTSAAVLAC